MQSKKVVKLAVIREKSESPCPYGLDIPDGCKTASKCVLNMQSIEGNKISDEDKEEVKEANKRILMLNGDKSKCKYANYIFENDKVECGFGDHADGAGPVNFRGTPTMTGYVGLMAVPPYDRVLDWSSNFGSGGIYNNIASDVDEEKIHKKAFEEDDKNK